MRRTALLCTCLLLGLTLRAAAQAEDTPSTDPRDQTNPNSIYKIPRARILFKQRVWREIHCEEPANRPFFAKGREITKIIFEGIKNGHLTPYKDEEFKEAMTQEEFWERLKHPGEDAPGHKEAEFDQEDDWGDGDKKEQSETTEENADYFFPHEVSVLEIMEDRIYDKLKGEMLNDIQAIQLIIPAKKFETGLRREVGILKFKDLYEYFKKLTDKAVWVNENNSARNLNLAEAFERRLFHSRIVKVENAEDATLEDIYKEKYLEVARNLETRFIEQECAFGEP